MVMGELSPPGLDVSIGERLDFIWGMNLDFCRQSIRKERVFNLNTHWTESLRNA